ncbi:MAG: hypothetical protein HYX27_13885 [Acidobacteria bacterium]|nr:hypothetical protein [Acidobacteriota bacterium]
MIIALAALIVIGVLFFTLRIKDKDLPPAESETPMKPLEDAKARVYEGLRDLQFEYRVGKLSDEDYQASKAELQKELARVLQQMDALGASSAPAPAAPKMKGNVCPHCGASFKEKLKFCGQCGKSMEAGA